jgi:hypothetical protein
MDVTGKLRETTPSMTMTLLWQSKVDDDPQSGGCGPFGGSTDGGARTD